MLVHGRSGKGIKSEYFIMFAKANIGLPRTLFSFVIPCFEEKCTAVKRHKNITSILLVGYLSSRVDSNLEAKRKRSRPTPPSNTLIKPCHNLVTLKIICKRYSDASPSAIITILINMECARSIGV